MTDFTIIVPVGERSAFVSDSVMHADLLTELGTVPSQYANHQMIRSIAAHINIDTTMSFDVSASTTIVYASPSLNDHDTFKPSWLTSGNGWTNTGRTGTISLPDALTASGTISVTVDYFEKTGVTGTFSFAGFRSSNWDEVLAHYVGVFLIPSGITVSNIVPEHYELIPDISASYVAPDRDEFYWNDTPPTSYGAATETATSWAEFHTLAEAASPGDEIAITDGPYDDDGLIIINDLVGTAANPVILRAETPFGATASGSTRLELDNCDFVIVEGIVFNAIDGGSFASALRTRSDCNWCSIRNCKETNRADANSNNFGFRISGNYMSTHNCDLDNFDDGSQFLRFESTTPQGIYSRFHHIDVTASVDATAGNANEVMQLGSSGTGAPPFTGILFDHCRVDGFDMGTEAETISGKSAGWQVLNCIFSQQDGSIQNRFGCDYLMGFNRLENATLQSNKAGSGQILGCDEDRTDGVHCLNTHDFCTTPNGQWELWRVDSTSTNRRAADRVLIVGDQVTGGDDQVLKTSTSGSATLVKAMNVKFVGCSSHVTTDAFNLTDHSLDVTVTFEDCQIFGTTADPGDNPSGNTYTDPLYVDRSDGIPTPTAGVIAFGIHNCFPGRLEGGDIDNLGAPGSG